MPKKLFSTSLLLLCLGFVQPIPVHATTVNFDASKKSLCVTARTQKLNAAAVANMEKDTAPYLKNPSATKAVNAYKESISVAWEAMEQPYCGFGSPGASSATKSYNKTIERARSTFLTQIKNLKAGSLPITTSTQEIIPKTVSSTETSHTISPTTSTSPVTNIAKKVVAIAVKPLTPPTPTPSTRGTVIGGLERGMKSPSVLTLQQVLLAHFKLDPADATNYFGPRTEQLVIRFQLEQNIISSRTSSGAGYVGRRTANALNNL